MHTLLVHYLPRGERSRTRRLVQAFLAECGRQSVESVDLALHPPAALDTRRLQAYVRRNYAGEALTAEEAESLAGADTLCDQLCRADAVVLAFPMFNFCVPAAVKAWLDAVMQKGRTWNVQQGAPVGLRKGKRALVLMTCGGLFEGARAGWDHAGPLACHAFEFMGFSEIRLVRAEGMNADPARAEARLEEAQKAAGAVAREWFATSAMAAVNA